MCRLVEAQQGPFSHPPCFRETEFPTTLSTCALLTAPGFLFLNSRPLTFLAAESLIENHSGGWPAPAPLQVNRQFSQAKQTGFYSLDLAIWTK